MRKLIFLTLFFSLFNISSAQWQEVQFINTLNRVPSDIKTFGNIGFMTFSLDTLKKTTDGGLTWFNSPAPSINSNEITKVNNTIWITNSDNAPMRSTDNGNTFQIMRNGMIDLDENFCKVVGNTSRIFISTRFNPLQKATYYSTNNGDFWNRIDTISDLGYKTLDILCSDSNVFLSTDHFIYQSSNNGINWSHIEPPNSEVIIAFYVFKANDFLFINSGVPGIFKSANFGANWKSMNYGLRDTAVNYPTKTESNGSYLFTTNFFLSRLYYCSAADTIWKRASLVGVPSQSIISFYVAGEYIYVYSITDTTKHIFRRKISEVVSISQNSTEVPLNFTLFQNYPNPFNPSTIINYQLTVNSFVTLNIYDVNGRLVKELVNKKQSAGSYEVNFDGSGLPSGTYIYRLQAGDFSESRKMVLLK